MAKESSISWTHATYNPWIGCTKVSPGCANCYAAALDKRKKFTPEELWSLKQFPAQGGAA